MIAGPSSCGKSFLLEQIISRWQEVLDHKPTKIYICHAHDQPIYERIKQVAPCPVELIQSLPSDLKTEPGSLIIIDDLVAECPKQIKDWFVRLSHHSLVDTCLLSQNLFERNKEYRTTSLNSHYIILFKNPRDSSQISHFAKQFSPTDTHFIINSFRDSTIEPHSYILFDLKQSTPNLLRVRSSVFPSESFVYVPNSTEVIIPDGFQSSEKNATCTSTLGKFKTKGSKKNPSKCK